MIWLSYIVIIALGCAALAEFMARLLQSRVLVNRVSNPRYEADFVADSRTDRFVSVHVATYNEPPSLVIATLESLARSRYDHFEVIVVDNNTADPAVWRPVAAAARRLGPRFRFIHIDRLAGAKAGALNVALAHADPRAAYVAVVDADYQVDSEFLTDSVSALLARRVDYVQFPQAYRGVGRAARGVEHELGDYFACFSTSAGRSGFMLPTGTLSMFTVAALTAVGGWPVQTITEDAEIGVRLQAAGYRGLWLARDRGRGLLPLDFQGLRKQRARWAAGNFQVLKRLHGVGRAKLTMGERLHLVGQLTAWISLLLPASAALLLVCVCQTIPLSGLIGDIAAGTILGSAALTALRMVLLNRSGVSWRVRVDAFATKTALTWTSATAWIPAIAPRRLRFHRTSKTIAVKRRDGHAFLGAVSTVFVAAGIIFALRGQYFEAAACALLASIWVCARAVDASLRQAASSNVELRG